MLVSDLVEKIDAGANVNGMAAFLEQITRFPVRLHMASRRRDAARRRR